MAQLAYQNNPTPANYTAQVNAQAVYDATQGAAATPGTNTDAIDQFNFKYGM